MLQPPYPNLDLLMHSDDPLRAFTPLACSTTNLKANSLCQVKVGCDVMWSKAQQFACMRISKCNTFIHQGKYISFSDYAEVARGIAATYARFYLETEEHGNYKLRGRYYWMALAAFASKTVACTLDSLQLQIIKRRLPDMEVIRACLAKGNIWLFQDIAATHWLYSYDAESYAKCRWARGPEVYLYPVKHNLCVLPWSEEAAKSTNYLQITPEIQQAFALIKKIIAENDEAAKRKLQLKHLLLVAEHEQQLLQKLIYDNAHFAEWTIIQSELPSIMVPSLEINFTSSCSTPHPEFKSTAPDNIIISNYKQRMDWITQVAIQFHGLMKKYPKQMDTYLTAIANQHKPIKP